MRLDEYGRWVSDDGAYIWDETAQVWQPATVSVPLPPPPSPLGPDGDVLGRESTGQGPVGRTGGQPDWQNGSASDAGAYNAGPGYDSGPGYDAGPGYDGSPGYDGGPGYGSSAGYGSSPGYGTGPGYDTSAVDEAYNPGAGQLSAQGWPDSTWGVTGEYSLPLTGQSTGTDPASAWSQPPVDPLNSASYLLDAGGMGTGGWPVQAADPLGTGPYPLDTGGYQTGTGSYPIDPGAYPLNTGALDVGALNPAALNPAALNPAALNPAALNPGTVNPGAFDPPALNPGALSPAALNPGSADTGALEIGSGAAGSLDSGGWPVQPADPHGDGASSWGSGHDTGANALWQPAGGTEALSPPTGGIPTWSLDPAATGEFPPTDGVAGAGTDGYELPPGYQAAVPAEYQDPGAYADEEWDPDADDDADGYVPAGALARRGPAARRALGSGAGVSRNSRLAALARSRPALLGVGLVVVVVLGFLTVALVGGNDNPEPQAAGSIAGRYEEAFRRSYLDTCIKASNTNAADYCSCTLAKFEADYTQDEFVRLSTDLTGPESREAVRQVTESCRAGQ